MRGDGFFSEWCALCVAGDYRDHPSGSHQRHVREAQQKLREHLAKRFTWRWQQEPLPQGSGAGVLLPTQHVGPTDQIHTEPDETAGDQPMS